MIENHPYSDKIGSGVAFLRPRSITGLSKESNHFRAFNPNNFSPFLNTISSNSSCVTSPLALKSSIKFFPISSQNGHPTEKRIRIGGIVFTKQAIDATENIPLVVTQILFNHTSLKLVLGFSGQFYVALMMWSSMKGISRPI